MLTDREIEEIFAPLTWNSEVRLKDPDADIKYGFQTGAVVGLVVIETPELAEKLEHPIGSRFVEIEGPSGRTISVPVDCVELVDV